MMGGHADMLLAERGTHIGTSKDEQLWVSAKSANSTPTATKPPSSTDWQATPKNNAAAAHLCAELNATETLYSGTDLRMIFKSVSS